MKYDPQTTTSKPPEAWTDFNGTHSLTPITNPVGYYLWGEVDVAVFRKPNWFQRKMIRVCFGWGWRDHD